MELDGFHGNFPGAKNRSMNFAAWIKGHEWLPISGGHNNLSEIDDGRVVTPIGYCKRHGGPGRGRVFEFCRVDSLDANVKTANGCSARAKGLAPGAK